jgi:hypothetical protein
MNITRCPAGHFYDRDEYDRCPHCDGRTEEKKSPRKPEQPAAGQEKKPKRISVMAVFGRKKAATPEGVREYECEPTEMMSKEELDKLFGAASSGKSSGPNVLTAPEAVSEKPAEEAVPAAPSSPEKKEKTSGNVPAWAEKTPLVPSETVLLYSVPSAAGRNDPPVGWLTGISGPYWGRSFPVHSGGNSVGRSRNNDIVLSDDDRVSRDKHARVVYEPRDRLFYIESGEGKGLAYLNGENILHLTPLSAFDVIEIGGGSYVFTPLCGSSFTWEDHPGDAAGIK